jgi:hypothetical protein
MSLVSDALRRARQEAAQREGRPGPPRVPAAIVHSSRGSRLGLGLVLGAVITLLAAGGGGLVAWWVLGVGASRQPASGARPTTTLPPAVDHDPPVAAAGPAPSAPAPPVEEQHRQALAAPPAVASEREAAAGETGGPGVSAHADVDSAAAATERPMPTPAAPTTRTEARSPKGSPSSASGPREFVAEARVGDTTLVLDYIAYRPSDPFAQVNGVELHEGSHIDGFTVEKIARDRVELRDERGLVVLRVR